MSEISDYNLYNIDDLCVYWESGWRELARLGHRQCPHKLTDSGDKSKTPLQRVLLAIDEMWCPFLGLGKNLKVSKSLPAYEVTLNLAASSNQKPYSPLKREHVTVMAMYSYSLGTWARNKTKLEKTLQKFTDAFATSRNYKEAFSKIATKNNITRFTDYWSQQDVGWSKGEYLEYSIEPRLKKMMEWLQHGLGGNEACEEAWWHCLWLYMQPTIEMMLEIRKKIRANTPLYKQQIDTLDLYLENGFISIGIIQDDDDKHKVQVILKPYLRSGSSPFYVMSVVLLVQPAFDLAQELHQSFRESGPRFLRKCHAPTCGKWFYTKDKRVILCRSIVNGKSTKCRLEWTQYTRWLKSMNKDPAKYWDHPNLRELFAQKIQDKN